MVNAELSADLTQRPARRAGQLNRVLAELLGVLGWTGHLDILPQTAVWFQGVRSGGGTSIIGACVAAAGLVWTVTWAVRSWRKSGPEVVAEVGQGQVDVRGSLRVHFRSGDSKIMRLDEPWGTREKMNDQPPQPLSKKLRSRKPQATPQAAKTIETPVNATFVRNRGRAAVTVRRCFYYADLKVTGFEFEPQPSSSAWGDHLPKRLDQGEEIILVHEKVGMRVLWNAVMRDHDVKQCVYSVVLELGNGEQIFADPPMLITADMTDEEFEEALKKIGRLERREVLEPIPSMIPPRKRFKFFGKDQRQAVVMQDEVQDSAASKSY